MIMQPKRETFTFTKATGTKNVGMVLVTRLKSWEGLLVVILLSILCANAAIAPNFLTVENVVNLFQLSIEKMIVASVMTLLIINAEIDLSVASVMGLSAAMTAWFYQAGIAMPVSICFALLIGVAVGLFNGFWIAFMGLPSLVVTLAGLIGYRGVARIFIKDKAIGGFPDWFNAMGQKTLIGPLTVSIIIFLVLFAGVAIILHRTLWGRFIYVIGNSPKTAEFSGVSVRLIKLALFATSGFVAALAGILYAARLGSVRGDTASGFELDAITVVLLGGVSVFGGSGNMLGVGLAILVILNLRNGMGLADFPSNSQTSIIGALLILSVLLPNIVNHIKARFGRTKL